MPRTIALLLSLIAGLTWAAAPNSPGSPVYVTNQSLPVTFSGSTMTFSLSGSSVTVFTNPANPLAVSGTFSVTPSTQVIAGRGGAPISSYVVGSTTALHVLNVGAPNINNMSFIYVSSNVMTVGGTVSLTGLGKEVSVQAFNGSCTFMINGGSNVILEQNTDETYDMNYTFTNPSVTLLSQDVSAICKSRITGVN